MKYKLFEIGPVTVYSYGLMIAIGIVLAFLVAESRAKKRGLNGDDIYGLGILGLIGGVIGAKLLFFLTEIDSILENPKIMLSFSEGFVVYGGILGGIVGAYIYCKWKKLSVLKYFDLAVPSLALAQGFGRIGCFLAGCCYGRETSAWYGITVCSKWSIFNSDTIIVKRGGFSALFSVDLYCREEEKGRYCRCGIYDFL